MKVQDISLSGLQKRMSLVFVLVVLLSIVGWTVAAQDGTGQFCVRSYEDRNNNMIQDAGEPQILRGITANLLDVNGIVINTTSIEDSPTAAQGVLCFPQLSDGQYSVQIVSSIYTATTPDTFTTVITANSLPTVFEYGGQVVVNEVVGGTDLADSEFTRSQLQGIFLALIASAVVMATMIVIGFILFFVIFRKRLKQDAVDMATTPYFTDEDTGTSRPL